MKLNELMPVMEACFENRISLELRGAPGIGKTAIVHQFVAHMQEKLGKPVGLLCEHLSTVESVDLD